MEERRGGGEGPGCRRGEIPGKGRCSWECIGGRGVWAVPSFDGRSFFIVSFLLLFLTEFRGNG